MRRLLLVATFCASCSAQILGPIITSKPGCTPSYTNEVITGIVATAGPNATEGDALTGWDGTGLATFDTAGTPYSGTLALNAIANANGTGAYYLLSGLANNQVYSLSMWVRHNGSGGTWTCGIGSTLSLQNIFKLSVPVTLTDYTQIKTLFRWNSQSDTLGCVEANGTNNGGVFVDAVSVTKATPCLGSELHVSANAASLAPNEANDITGWTARNSLDSFVSDGTGPADGSYHLKADATTNPAAGNGFNIDLSSLGAQNGKNYLLLFKSKHLGSGDGWMCGHSSTDIGTVNTSGKYVTISNSISTYTGFGWKVAYDANQRYFVCNENGSNNNGGLYIDAFSFKEVVAE